MQTKKNFLSYHQIFNNYSYLYLLFKKSKNSKMSKIKKTETNEIAKLQIAIAKENELSNNLNAETMQENAENQEIVIDSENANNDLPQDGDKSPIIERSPEIISNEIHAEKEILNELERKFNFDEENAEIIAQEKKISDLKDERKNLVKEIAKKKMETEYNAKYDLAFNDLLEKFAIDGDKLKSLIEETKTTTEEKPSTLISSFNLVFGKKPLFIAENVKGTDLSKKSPSGDGDKINLSKMIKDAIDAGKPQDEIVTMIFNNSELDMPKSKKRFTDVSWQYAQTKK